MSEANKAKAWRERHGLTLQKLSELSGYSPAALLWFERGLTPARTAKHVAGKATSEKERAIKWWVWQRYKLVMAAIDHQLKTGEKFEW